MWDDIVARRLKVGLTGREKSMSEKNVVNGVISKSHPKSWFERFHIDSKKGWHLFHEDRYGSTIILQMMSCGDLVVIAECVSREDYEANNEV